MEPRDPPRRLPEADQGPGGRELRRELRQLADESHRHQLLEAAHQPVQELPGEPGRRVHAEPVAAPVGGAVLPIRRGRQRHRLHLHREHRGRQHRPLRLRRLRPGRRRRGHQQQEGDDVLVLGVADVAPGHDRQADPGLRPERHADLRRLVRLAAREAVPGLQPPRRDGRAHRRLGPEQPRHLHRWRRAAVQLLRRHDHAPGARVPQQRLDAHRPVDAVAGRRLHRRDAQGLRLRALWRHRGRRLHAAVRRLCERHLEEVHAVGGPEVPAGHRQPVLPRLRTQLPRTGQQHDHAEQRGDPVLPAEPGRSRLQRHHRRAAVHGQQQQA